MAQGNELIKIARELDKLVQANADKRMKQLTNRCISAEGLNAYFLSIIKFLVDKFEMEEDIKDQYDWAQNYRKECQRKDIFAGAEFASVATVNAIHDEEVWKEIIDMVKSFKEEEGA